MCEDFEIYFQLCMARQKYYSKILAYVCNNGKKIDSRSPDQSSDEHNH